MEGPSSSSDQAALIFEQARQLAEAARETYLREACKNDSELRRLIDDLLVANAKQGDFLAEPTHAGPLEAAEELGAADHAGEATTELPASSLNAPESRLIGRYKLLQRIGEGGFGEVWMAEQREPIKRRVALKIIKAGMDSRQVIARFEAERQALAMMDHPNIARVLDAGVTDAGRPYFVMELVRGVPITEYADAESLDPLARLELFTGVCNAVQHAHQKGIIHRDIKPSNVLVTVTDGKPVPKVIDFGIAKATGGELTDKTLFTEFGQFIGTPQYMSPEQAGMSGVDIDTRSDVYSLGVLLYELLTGVTPFDAARLRSAALEEMRRIIREEEPPRPSTRVSTLGDALSAVARHRRVEPGRLGALIRGDLDWITMKCLEKDRGRRYGTASDLAADVQRHLTGEAVVAAPPSRVYRFHRFVRRNRAVVTAAGLVAAALVLGIAGTAAGLVKANRERQGAEEAQDRLRIALAESNKRLAFLSLVEAGAKAMRPNPDMDKAFAGLLAAFGAFSEARPTVSEDEELRFHVDALWVMSTIYGDFRSQELRQRPRAHVLLERGLGVCERAFAADPSAVVAWSFGTPAPLRSVLARGLYDLSAWAPDDKEERFLARSLACFGDERLLELPGEYKPLARATVELRLLERTLASAAPEQLAADLCRLLKELAPLKVGRPSEAPIRGHEIGSVIGLGCRLLERDVSAVRQVVRCIREFEATTTRRFEGDTSFELESLELAVAVIDGDIDLAKARVEGVLGRLKHGPIRAMGMGLPLTVAARVLRNDRAKATLFEKHGILARVKRAAFLTQAEWIRQFNGWSPYLNEFAWTTVSQADQDLEHYTIALGWAEEAVRHDPDNAQILNTLGVAQYRVGAYDKALATLTRSDELDRRPDASRNGSSTSAPASQPVRSGAADLFHPANAAFIAMAQFKLGHVDEAKASLARLRELMRDTRHAANEEYQAFLADAANLIEGPSRSPTTAPATQRTSPR